MEPIAVDRPPALRELGPGDAPFPGTLRGGEVPTVWVDAAAFESSPAWRAADAEHVLRPLDLAQGEDGLQVLLPHCPVRVEAILGPEELSDGAAVTFAVSALRGALEADRLDAPIGSWWVTSDGRPVLALTGSTPWRDETVAMIHEVADHARPQLADILHRTAATISDPRLLVRESADIEGELFGVAAAEPLPTAAVSAEVASVAGRRPSPPRDVGGARGRLLHEVVARFVDRELARRLRATVVPVRRRGRRGRSASPRPAATARSRRRLWIPAAAAAVAVMVVGLSWPTDGEAPAEASDTRTASASDAGKRVESDGTGTSESSVTPAASADVGPPELIAATRALLDDGATCEDRCDAVWEDAGAWRPVEAAAGAYRLEIVDEYGGVAAVRVSGAERTQVVVVVESDERWLIRDVYDVAQEP